MHLLHAVAYLPDLTINRAVSATNKDVICWPESLNYGNFLISLALLN